jgi:hypothetical protein
MATAHAKHHAKTAQHQPAMEPVRQVKIASITALHALAKILAPTLQHQPAAAFAS